MSRVTQYPPPPDMQLLATWAEHGIPDDVATRDNSRLVARQILDWVDQLDESYQEIVDALAGCDCPRGRTRPADGTLLDLIDAAADR